MKHAGGVSRTMSSRIYSQFGRTNKTSQKTCELCSGPSQTVPSSVDVATSIITEEADLPSCPQGTKPAFLRPTAVAGPRHPFTLSFSLSPRNFSTIYTIMTKKSQSHLLPSQLWECSGRLCLTRKCPPQGTFPGLSLVFSLSEENMKAQVQEMHRGRNRNHLSVRMVSRGWAENSSWWVCLPWHQRAWAPSVGPW